MDFNHKTTERQAECTLLNPSKASTQLFSPSTALCKGAQLGKPHQKSPWMVEEGTCAANKLITDTNYTLLMWKQQDMGGEEGGRSSCPRQGGLFWFVNHASPPRSPSDTHSQTISSLGQQQG